MMNGIFGEVAAFQRPSGTPALWACRVILSGGSRYIAPRFRFTTGYPPPGLRPEERSSFRYFSSFQKMSLIMTESSLHSTCAS